MSPAIKRTQEIGWEKKMAKLPSDMRRDWRKAFSMIGARTRAKMKGAASYLNLRIR